MPAQQRRWGDEPVIPQLAGEQSAERGEHDAVGGLQVRPADLAAQDLDFLAQDE